MHSQEGAPVADEGHLPGALVDQDAVDRDAAYKSKHLNTGTALRTYLDLDYPWAAADAGLAKTLEDGSRAFVRAHGLVSDADLPRRFDPVNVGLLTALTFPETAVPRQQMISDLLAWIFLQDDRYDEMRTGHDPDALRRTFDRYGEILRTLRTREDASGTEVALLEVAERMSAVAEPEWFEWFSYSMRGFWIDGLVEETRLRAIDVTPDVPTYTRMRIHSIGVLPFLDLVEFAADFALPRIVAAESTLALLRSRAAKIIAYANDVFSYEKERRAGDPNNLVHILQVHHGLPLHDAVDRAVAMHDEELALFMREAETLPAWGDEVERHLQRYLQGHRDWMRGALDWQLQSRRYDSGREYLRT